MISIGDVTIQTSQNAMGTRMRLAVEYDGEIPEDASTRSYSGEKVQTLDAREVEQLRDACETFLRGERL